MEKKKTDAEREYREQRSPEIREIIDSRPSHILRYGTLYLILAASLAVGTAAICSPSFRAFLATVF